MAIFDAFHKVAALTRSQVAFAAVERDEQVRFHERAEQPEEAAATMGEFEVGIETGQPRVYHGQVIAADPLTQGAVGKPCGSPAKWRAHSPPFWLALVPAP